MSENTQMHHFPHFSYIDNHLYAENVSLADIATAVGTPFYCYSTAALTDAFTAFRDSFVNIEMDAVVCYAMKANTTLAVARTFARLGAGADVVSEGEMRFALEAGVPAEKIVFSGVGKTHRELAAAVEARIMQVNIESEPELMALSEIASSRGVTMPIAVRVNPDVDAKTHAKITTGKKGNKFGIDWERAREVYALARRLPGIEIAGVDCHLGSQITRLEPFENGFSRIRDLVLALRADGIALKRIDLGGGLGISYNNEQPPPPSAYVSILHGILGDLDCQIVVEPGRFLVGNAGVLVSRVVYTKKTSSKIFVIVDAGMNDLVRPAMYDAYHAIRPLVEASTGVGAPVDVVDVVGPICESSDVFAKNVMLPPMEAGDLLAFMSAGAYGAVMASMYNGRPLIPEVMVRGTEFSIVRPRPSYEEMMAGQTYPDWLE